MYRFKYLFSLIIFCLFFNILSAACISSKKNIDKPNVVFIMVDDLGWSDLAYMGSSYYESPNIDKLAEKGLVFTSAYAGAANCAPSRAALMSGMSAPRTGVYTVSPSARGNKKTRKLIPIENTEFLNDSVFSMAEMFKEAGYVTGNFGKWHVSEDPLSQGFDVNVGGGRWGHPKSYIAPYIYPDLEAPDGEYLTDRLTNEAVNFIEDNKKNPFFLYLPFYTVHTPIQPKDQSVVERYKNKKGDEYHNRADYAAMIETMDKSVGEIISKLDELKLENTLIVFTSDNGGVYKISKQAPLRSGKGSYYEGGVRVPLIMSWPGVIRSGKTDLPVSNLDFYPTFKEIIKGKIKCNQVMDGVSLKQFLVEEKMPNKRALFFHFPIYLQGYAKLKGVNRDPLFRTRPGTSVRFGDWKLLYFYEDKGIELYNLKNDIGERENLATKYPEKAKELQNMMEAWLQDTNAPIPYELNVAYDKDFERRQVFKE